MARNSEKKLIGSVAVDSETGMEHYQVPKAKNESKDGTAMRAGFHTPNYGEQADEKQENNLAGVPEEFLNLFEHDASEVILMQATRHPIGVIAIFILAGIAAAVVIAAFLFVVDDSAMLDFAGLNAASVSAIGSLVVVVVIALIAVIAVLAAYVYKKSRMILTNQKVVLIQYNSLISRKVSQLNIGEVEDVNVAQPTLLDRIFKTGRITIETAGEQNNYVLTQIEDPYGFARKTIQVHEGSIAEYGN